jgi:hypothetical protein
MARVSLLGGTYLARSIIASAQRCVNLYPEKNPQDSEAPYTHYPTPGLKHLLNPLTPGVGRGLYTATNGELYYVCGQTVYFIASNFVQTALGNLSAPKTTPVSMVDNGQVLVIVDGSPSGYAIDLTSNTFGTITDPNFLGADSVDYVDTFFVFNQPGTRNWYSSLSNISFAALCTNPGRPQAGAITSGGSGYTNGTYLATALTGGTGTGATADITVAGNIVTVVTLDNTGLGYTAGDALGASIPGGSGFEFTITQIFPAGFDPTWVAQKTGFPDQISTLLCIHREIWIFGIVKTTEVWYDAGGALFPFAIIPGVFIEHGCIAKYSATKHDLLVFWLSIDAAGRGTVYMGQGYAAKKISTPAVAFAFANYSTLVDAIGMVYKVGDHIFYVLSFPTADATWVYDVSEGMWHELSWLDPIAGVEHRHRMNCVAFAYEKNICADWQNGTLYQLDINTLSDFGGAIVRRRGFPHLMGESGGRVTYDMFRADMECGNGVPEDPTKQPQLTLRVSDTRGRTWWNPPTQSVGAQGMYYVQPQWRQLGLARDRVFELTWSDDVVTALNGAFIDITKTEGGT